ncbi:hypothetical protein HH682_15375, partial [Rosenbergiella sp. S61]|nr:hypothetical protein [Rosenbergiella gaditana]
MNQLPEIRELNMPAHLAHITAEDVARNLRNFLRDKEGGNDSNLLIVLYREVVPDDLIMQLHR